MNSEPISFHIIFVFGHFRAKLYSGFEWKIFWIYSEWLSNEILLFLLRVILTDKCERKLYFLNRVIWIILFLLGFSLFCIQFLGCSAWNKDMSCFRWWWQLIYQQTKLYSLANSQIYQLSRNCDILTHMNSLILAISK